jgi:hypothetical protein
METSFDHSFAKLGHAHFADQLKHLQSAAMRHRRAHISRFANAAGREQA